MDIEMRKEKSVRGNIVVGKEWVVGEENMV